MTDTAPNASDLGVIITSSRVRQLIYSVYVLTLVLASAIQVGYSALHVGPPSWLVVTIAVLAYLGIPVGGLAVANTSTKSWTGSGTQGS